MRELDELLLRYLVQRYPTSDDAQKAAFIEVLALSDPELNGYLLQRHAPSSESIAGIIQQILSLPQA